MATEEKTPTWARVIILILIAVLISNYFFDYGFKHGGKKLCRSLNMELSSTFAVGDTGIRSNIWCEDKNGNDIYIELVPDMELSNAINEKLYFEYSYNNTEDLYDNGTGLNYGSDAIKNNGD